MFVKKIPSTVAGTYYPLGDLIAVRGGGIDLTLSEERTYLPKYLGSENIQYKIEHFCPNVGEFI